MHETMPYLSVVIPCYNHGTFLARAAQTVFENSPPSTELIIVNDGSTDETSEVLAELSKDERIRILHQKNQGIASALNKGFSQARGTYLSWTSADNEYCNSALIHLAHYLERNPSCGLVYANVQLIDEHGRAFRNTSYRVPDQRTEDSSILNLPCDTENLSRFADNFINACFLYRRFLGDICGSYRSEFLGFEDYEYWLRIQRHSRIDKLDSEECFYKYRLHSNSLTAKLDSDSLVQQQSELLDSIAQHRRQKHTLTLKFNPKNCEALALRLIKILQNDGYKVLSSSDPALAERVHLSGRNEILIRSYLKNQPLDLDRWLIAEAGSNRFVFSIPGGDYQILKRARTANFQAVSKAEGQQYVLTFIPSESKEALEQIKNLISAFPSIVFVGFCRTASQRNFCDSLNLKAETPSNYRIVDVSENTSGQIVSLMYVLSSSDGVLFCGKESLGAQDLLEIQNLSMISCAAGLALFVNSDLGEIADNATLIEKWRSLPFLCTDLAEIADSRLSKEDLETCDDWIAAHEEGVVAKNLYQLANPLF